MSRLNSFIFALLALLASITAQAGTITTVAGGGPNNMQAISANVDSPLAVVVDSIGNRYIAATGQNRIFKVDIADKLTVVAGNGTPGFSGDGGLAPDATLYGPAGLALDSNNNLYIADSSNLRIRRIDLTTGIISTVAGDGMCSFGGTTGDGGLATSAHLCYPQGVAVDNSGNLYIADYLNQSIRMVDFTTQNIDTVAGNGLCTFGGPIGDGGAATSAQLCYPQGVAVDNSGIYIADSGNGLIRKVDIVNHNISTVAGGGAGFVDVGLATATRLVPVGVALDRVGNLYIAEPTNNRIRMVANGNISTVAGGGTYGFSGDGTAATGANVALANPYGVAVDNDGNLYIADTFNNRIRKVNNAGPIGTFGTFGSINTVVGNGTPGFSGDGALATWASLYNNTSARKLGKFFLDLKELRIRGNFYGVAVDSIGNFYIADTGNNRIRMVDTTGNISTVAGNGTPGFGGDGTPATGANLNNPTGVAVDSVGNLYIADLGNNCIRRVATDGTINTVAGNGIYGYSGDGMPATGANLNSPYGVAVDSLNNLYIADTGNSSIRKVDTNGIISTVAGNGMPGLSGDGTPATGAQLGYPTGVAVDSLGNLYIADQANNLIRKVNVGLTVGTFGNINTVAGGGTGFVDGGPATGSSLLFPESVAVDGIGNIYIADTYDRRIRKVDVATGNISTVAGDGNYGFSGDGGDATLAALTYPTGLSLDRNGNLYFSDPGNNRIRMVAGIGVFPPVITQNPTAQTACEGGKVSFTAAASGSPAPAVQWQVSTNGTIWADIVGATSTTLTFPALLADNGKQYRAVFSNTSGSAASVTTTAATLTVNPVPVVATNPASHTVTTGSPVTFSAAANSALTVQWQVSTDAGMNWIDIAGATLTTLTLSTTLVTDNGYQYRAVFANDCGTVPTSVATLTVNAPALQPDLTITKTHAGSCTKGQSIAYTITAGNIGNNATAGMVTVKDTLPAGLSASKLSGKGWACNKATGTCTRKDVLAAGASYPAITYAVNVLSTAPASITNTVSVSGGGEVNTANNTASDPATIVQPPDLTITKTHAANFSRGQTGATYTITVANMGGAPTSGKVSVTDSLPSGLTATAMSGTGWTCTTSRSPNCKRSDALAPGASYPPITLTVNVSKKAAASVTNRASVSGGGEINKANNTASDPTIIGLAKANQTISFGAAPAVVVGGTGSVSATATSGLAVSYSTTTPSACTVDAGTGLVAGLAAGTSNCTIAANQAGDANYNPAPQVTQNITVGASQPPIADFTFTPTTGGIPLTVTFNGSPSSTPNGSITNYSWDFGDGTSTSGSFQITHIYQTPGTYLIVLTVTDSAGRTAMKTAQIVVTQPQLPVAAFTYTVDTTTGAIIVNADGLSSSSPNGTIVSYTWDFGDGVLGTGAIAAHTYLVPGTYILTLYVTDSVGYTSSSSQIITVP